MEAYLNNARYIEIYVALAINFLMRNHGWTYNNAKAEIDMIGERIGHADFIRAFNNPEYNNLKWGNEAYVRMSRIGAKFKLNRHERVTIALTLNRAAEHAAFNFEVENGTNFPT